MKIKNRFRKFPFKIEVAILLFSAYISIFKIQSIINFLEDYYKNINAAANNGEMIAFLTIIIGIYISIITIISTSRIPASRLILENQLEDRIILFVFPAIIMNIIEILYILLAPDFKYYIVFYFSLFCIQIVMLIKFIIFILMICKTNVNEVVKEIDDADAKEKELYALLCSIRDRIK